MDEAYAQNEQLYQHMSERKKEITQLVFWKVKKKKKVYLNKSIYHLLFNNPPSLLILKTIM